MLNIYLDENFANQEAEALNCFERQDNLIRVLSTRVVFGVSASDDAIVNGMVKDTDFLVTKDNDFAREKHLTTLIKEHKVGMFIFRPPKGTGYWIRIEYFIKAWPNIRGAAMNKRPPFIFEFRTNGKLKELSL